MSQFVTMLHIDDYSLNLYDPMPNHTLALSGSLFILSSWTAFAHENYITSLLSFLLSLTSVSYHLDRTFTSFLLDQIALYSVVARSFMDGYHGDLPGLSIAFIVNGYNLFIYFGPLAKYTTFHSDRTIATRWHMSIHIFAILAIITQQLLIPIKQLSPAPFSSMTHP